MGSVSIQITQITTIFMQQRIDFVEMNWMQRECIDGDARVSSVLDGEYKRIIFVPASRNQSTFLKSNQIGEPRCAPKIAMSETDSMSRISSSDLAVKIDGFRDLQKLNDRRALPVYFDTLKSSRPEITLKGRQGDFFSLWETYSTGKYITKPMSEPKVVTVRFVTSGSITYRSTAGNAVGTPAYATLVSFERLREVQASDAFGALSVTVGVERLLEANRALEGEHHTVPEFAPIADLALPGVRALSLTLVKLLRYSQANDMQNDLMSPLFEEIVSYQILSSWPKFVEVSKTQDEFASTRSFRRALDYIAVNIGNRLSLSDVASAAGISVRALQLKFKKEFGQTPVEYIIGQRLSGVHRDLTSPSSNQARISEIARRWGFVHLSDFSQRYRRQFGCTPVDTQRAFRGDN